LDLGSCPDPWPEDLGDSGELAAELLLTGMLKGATTEEPGGGGGFREQQEHRLWKGDTPEME